MDDKEKIELNKVKGGPKGGPGPMKNMSSAGAKPKNAKKTIKRLFSSFGKEKYKFSFSILLAMCFSTSVVLGPKFLGKITDEIFNGVMGKSIPLLYKQNTGKDMPPGLSKADIVEYLNAHGQGTLAKTLSGMNVIPGVGVSFSTIFHLMVILICVYLFTHLCSYFQNFITTGIVQRFGYILRKKVNNKVSKLPLSYFDTQSKGDILSRVTNDVDNITQSLQQTLGMLFSQLCMLIAVTIMMFTVKWEFALIVILSVPIAGIIITFIGKKSQKYFNFQWKFTGMLNGQIEEMYTGHTLVRIFQQNKKVVQKFEKTNEDIYTNSYKAQFLTGLMQPIMMFVSNLSYVLIAFLGALRILNGTMTLGEIQQFVMYSRQFTQPVTQIASMVNLFQSMLSSAERVFELLDEKEQENESTKPKKIKKPQGLIEFKNVDFSYKKDIELIKNLNLTAKPGESIAIVGQTGAGKTTLVNLIMRFYDIDSGKITYNETDIQSVRRTAIRKRVAMVLQDTWLFNGTIFDNIKYGNEDASDGQVYEAAKATYVDRFVSKLPDGYKTVINEESSNVSDGEKQLITIARAFLANSNILILDEATSAVDTRTEKLVQNAMSKIRKGKTSFIIAHRLSTIRDANQILVMDSGHIVEQGNHKQLMKKGGVYANLYNSQFAGNAT